MSDQMKLWLARIILYGSQAALYIGLFIICVTSVGLKGTLIGLGIGLLVIGFLFLIAWAMEYLEDYGQ